MRDHPFSTYKFIFEKITFLNPDMHTYLAYQGVRNVSLGGTFASEMQNLSINLF